MITSLIDIFDDLVSVFVIWRVYCIVCAGDDPADVKTKLRHWAQAVACSVMQSH